MRNNADFLTFINALGKAASGPSLATDGDAEDMRNGAAYIPAAVTDARRRGENVRFVQGRPKDQWYWEMPDKTRVPYDP